MEDPHSLLTSFGAFGRAKLLSNIAGSAIITKDAQLILPHLLQYINDPFLRLSAEQCIKRAAIRGDGLLSSLIVESYLIRHIDERIGTSNSARNSDLATNPATHMTCVALRTGLSAILHAVAYSTQQQLIVDAMVQSQAWQAVVVRQSPSSSQLPASGSAGARREVDPRGVPPIVPDPSGVTTHTSPANITCREYVRGLCLNLLVPATSNIVALSICSALVSPVLI